MEYKDFYAELGKLLYAIAKADGNVGKKEFSAMKEIVKNELVPHETHRDQFGTDVAFYTEMEFEYLEENFGDAQSAFHSFLDFVELHKSSITPQLREMIKNISARIADSEYGINKKERAFLEKLNEKIKGL